MLHIKYLNELLHFFQSVSAGPHHESAHLYQYHVNTAWHCVLTILNFFTRTSWNLIIQCRFLYFFTISKIAVLFRAGKELFMFARQKLWQEAGQAFALARSLHTIADDYVKASEQYVLPSANQLTRFALPSSSRSAQQLLRELKVISSILHPKM